MHLALLPLHEPLLAPLLPVFQLPLLRYRDTSLNKNTPPRTLKKHYTWDPMVVIGGGAFSDKRGTPVGSRVKHFGFRVQVLGFEV